MFFQLADSFRLGIADIAEVQKGDNVMAYCTEEAWNLAKEEVAFVKKHNRQWGSCQVWEQEEARQVFRGGGAQGRYYIPRHAHWQLSNQLILNGRG